jgi:hypothetical protein
MADVSGKHEMAREALAEKFRSGWSSPFPAAGYSGLMRRK